MSQRSQLLSGRAIQIVAENKIRAAIEAGEFDNLPGLGKPAAIFDEPYDPHWWIRRKLKREQLLVTKSSVVGVTRHPSHVI
jgi:hypothetical protein